MGGRDHSCEGCGRGGFNNDLECICGNLPPRAIEKAIEAEGAPGDQDVAIKMLNEALPELEKTFIDGVLDSIYNISDENIETACEDGEVRELFVSAIEKHKDSGEPTETRWVGYACDPNGNVCQLDCRTDRDIVEAECRRVAKVWGSEVWLTAARVDEEDQLVGFEVRHDLDDVEYWHQGKDIKDLVQIKEELREMIRAYRDNQYTPGGNPVSADVVRKTTADRLEAIIDGSN